MSRQSVSDLQNSFIGGLNLSADIAQLKSNEVRRADNGRITEYGGITKRGGTQNIHASALASANIVTGNHWVRPAGLIQQLVVCNGLLHTATYGIPTTFTSQAGALSSTVHGDIESFRDGTNDVAYIADGGLLNKWDGTTLTVNIASTPAVTQLAVYNMRLFGITGADSTLYWSDIGNGDTLGITASSGGSAIIRTFGQQDLIGLLPLGSSLCLVHRAGISRFTGWSLDDIDISSGTQGISSDTGSIAPRSLVAVENVGYMVSDNGIYEITEFGVKSIGQKINSVIKDLDKTTFPNIQGVHHRAFNEIHFYFPNVGSYVYNYRLKAWTGPHYVSVNNVMGVPVIPGVVHSMWQTFDATGNPVVLQGTSKGFVRQMDVPGIFKDDVPSNGDVSDSGGAVFTGLVLQCHRMHFGDPELTKAFRSVYLTYSAELPIQGVVILWSESGYPQFNFPISSGGYLVWDAPGAIWNNLLTWPAAATQTRRFQLHGHSTYADVLVQDWTQGEVVISRVRVDGFNYAKRF